MTFQHEPPIIEAQSRPSLLAHTCLRQDATRDRWVILAPERVFELDAVAVAVLDLCDGSRSINDIAAVLAQSYNADRSQILADIIPMLQGLADKGVICPGSNDA